MGRIDPAGGIRERGTGWKVLLGVVGALVIALVIALVSYELGRRASAPPQRASDSPANAATPAAAPPAQAAVAATPVPQSTEELLAACERARPSPREERAATDVTAAQPAPAPAPAPAATAPLPEVTELPETPHDKLARCLSFRVENDEIHYAGYAPSVLPLKVTASNVCPFSFEGPSVSVEVRAIPSYGEGTIVRVVGNFQEPIPSLGRSETQFLIACPRCDQIAHRFEARLLP
jgi:hypothetical protein